jgi:uncharacterized membrane protein
MSSRKPDPWLIAAIAGGIFYPLLTYFCRAQISPKIFVLMGLVLIGMRLWGLRGKPEMRVWHTAFLFAAAGLVAILFLDASIAVLAYPVVISLSVAAVFGLSLYFPPSVVERIARLSEPDLPPDGVIYTRRVTVVWFIFLLLNAAISLATALVGTIAQWALWNGLISYLLMGALFAGEIAIRYKVVRNKVRQ